MPSYRRLQQYAVGISIISIVYNAAEGAVSIGLGAESSSRSLIFFGIQSGIEVLSAIMVVWRFRNVAKPGEERAAVLSPRDLKFERISSSVIACLLIALALATEGTAISGLVQHEEPSASNASLIVSASALVLMILVWLPKGYLAKALDSSAMQGETQCSLSCIQITIVLFSGSLIYRLWKGGWWVDSATSLVLGLLFGWEGLKMWRWARSPDFDGGCCGDYRCRQKDVEATAGKGDVAEKTDSCGCCSKPEPVDASKTPTSATSSTVSCCAPVNDGKKRSCSQGCCAPTTPVKPSGECCEDCRSREEDVSTADNGGSAAERLADKQRRDSCGCCSQPESCRSADESKLPTSDVSLTPSCCAPIDDVGKKGCGRGRGTTPVPAESYGGCCGDANRSCDEKGVENMDCKGDAVAETSRPAEKKTSLCECCPTPESEFRSADKSKIPDTSSTMSCCVFPDNNSKKCCGQERCVP